MEIITKKQQQILIITLNGRLDSLTSDDVQSTIEGLFEENNKHVLIDFSELIYISSAGVRVLIKVVKQAKNNSGRLAFCSLAPKVESVISILGLVQIFPIYKDREDAIENYFF